MPFGRRMQRLATTQAKPPSQTPECVRPPSVVDETGQMAKQYEFAGVEEALYEWWESQGFFKPIDEARNPKGKKPYVIPMPPPQRDRLPPHGPCHVCGARGHFGAFSPDARTTHPLAAGNGPRRHCHADAGGEGADR
ncbi:valine-trna ligase [Nannochloropsis oceanica]